MSRAPLITTVIPTYRRPDLLKRAVLSVLNQSCPHFIVRILDNASGDDTERVARELMRLDSRVEYHCHSENLGSLNNMISGMETVTTEYFNILCDDDLLMPDFFRRGLDIHQRANVPLAFVAARVVVVDGLGNFTAPPWTHPNARCRLAPPDGIAQCLKAGVSLPGAMYRTSAMKSIGPPRITWWNWTESGWHALAAINFPIEFSSEVGAIIYDHPDSGSKQMDRAEFRISWFRMLVELRGMALGNAVSNEWWTAHVLPLTYTRFVGTVMRLSNRDGVRTYGALRTLAVASGLNAPSVSAFIKLAQVARVLGVGGMVNGAYDLFLRRGDGVMRAPPPPHTGPEDSSPSRVFADLNRQAGLHSSG